MSRPPLRLACLLLLVGMAGCGDSGWRVEDTATVTAGPLLDQGHLFVTSSSFGLTRRLRSHNARTGQENWQVELGGWEDCTQLAAHELELLVGCGPSIYGFEATTGHLSWRRTMNGPVVEPLTLHDRVGILGTRLASGELELTGLASDTGQVTLREILPAGSLIARLPGLVVAASGDQLTGYEPGSGQQRWKHRLTTPPVKLLGSAAGLVVVTAQSLVGIDPRSGEEKWTRPTEGLVAPTTLEALICYAQGGLLLGIDAETGQEKWRRRIAGVIDAPGLTHDVVYVHTAGGVLHALSSFDGEPLWKLSVGLPGRVWALSDELYVWSSAHELHVVDLVQREVRTTIPLRSGRLSREDDPSSWPVQRPLLLVGSQLFGVEREGGLFMYDIAR